MLAEIPVSLQVLLAPGVIVGWFAIVGLLSLRLDRATVDRPRPTAAPLTTS